VRDAHAHERDGCARQREACADARIEFSGARRPISVQRIEAAAFVAVAGLNLQSRFSSMLFEESQHFADQFVRLAVIDGMGG
jgi:hypothetical protein